MISLVVAASTNNVIGADGGLPWRLPEDLKRFKEITMGNSIVMGRATWESIGRALPGRQNIVITRQAGYQAAGCDVVASIDAALALAASADEVMIIGGGKIYEQTLPIADRIYLTRIHASIDGDTFFPALADGEWTEVARERYPLQDGRQYAFDILTLDRVAQ